MHKGDCDIETHHTQSFIATSGQFRLEQQIINMWKAVDHIFSISSISHWWVEFTCKMFKYLSFQRYHFDLNLKSFLTFCWLYFSYLRLIRPNNSRLYCWSLHFRWTVCLFYTLAKRHVFLTDWKLIRNKILCCIVSTFSANTTSNFYQI